MRRSTELLCAAILLMALPSCGGAPPPVAGPLEEIRRALSRGDASALYANVTSETRALVGRDGVRALVDTHRAELAELAELLAHAEPTISVALRFEGGEPVAMVFEDGAFRLDGAVVAGTDLATPEGAVLALRAALLRRSLPALLRVLTRERARALVAEMDAVAEAAADRLDFDVAVTGARALVRLPEGLVIILERESDEWRVVDVAEDRRPR